MAHPSDKTDDGAAAPHTAAPVLIAGGYGVVGAQAARILRDRHPRLPLLLGGRRPEVAAELAAELGDAEAVALDVGAAADPIGSLPTRPAAVLCTVNDPDDRLLGAAIDHGVPIVDITRWTALVHRALARCAASPPRAPVLLGSGWMAGMAPLAAAWGARDLGSLDRIDIAIRYAMRDRSGPDSVEYVDRFAARFDTMVDGRPHRAVGLSDPRTARFADGATGRVYRIDTPEQLTLPVTLGARTVATRIGFDSATATGALVALRRVGVLRAVSHPRYARLRRAVLHQPGAGDAAQLRIELEGDGGNRTILLADPQGQSHLTAAGAAILVERVLGLDGGPPEPAGARFPEQHPDPDAAVAALRSCGVEVQG